MAQTHLQGISNYIELSIYYIVILFKRAQIWGQPAAKILLHQAHFLALFDLTIEESLFEDHAYFLLELKEEIVNGHYCGFYVKILRTFKRYETTFPMMSFISYS